MGSTKSAGDDDSSAAGSDSMIRKGRKTTPVSKFPSVTPLHFEKESASPKDEIASPKDEIASPKVEPTSPKVEPTSPKVEPTSPKVEPTSPKVEYASPRVEYALPRIETASPEVETASPNFEAPMHFKVTIYSTTKSKKRKRNETEPLQHFSSFDMNLNTIYTVSPKDKWEAMRKYSSFKINGVLFNVDEVVLISPDKSYIPRVSAKKRLVPLGTTLQSHWVAKVLGVRGKDERNVFLLIQWLYRPEDLEPPRAREPHHGSYELVASNYLQVIDAQSVDGHVKLKHWDEYDDETEPTDGEAFWRQVVDTTAPKYKYSTLRSYCVCGEHRNPDKLMIQCPNPTCKIWIHDECTVRKMKAHIRKGAFDIVARATGEAAPEVKVDLDGKSMKLVCTGPRTGKIETWRTDIQCLRCKQKIH